MPRTTTKSGWPDAETGANIGMNVGRCGDVRFFLASVAARSCSIADRKSVNQRAAREGFGGDDGRSSIFDYWSMPELVKWINESQVRRRQALAGAEEHCGRVMGGLLALINEPAFRDGNFFALNPGNNRNPNFGQTGSEPAGGHWLYAFLRVDSVSRQRFLVAVNLHPKEELKGNRIMFSPEAVRFLELAPNESRIHGRERLEEKTNSSPAYRLLALPTGSPFDLLPLTAYFFEIAAVAD